MTRGEVGELYLKLQKPMLGWLRKQGLEPDQGEDLVNDAFCYLLETKDHRSGLPLSPLRYQRRSPGEVESLLWDRLRGSVTDLRRDDTRRQETEYELIRGLSPSLFKGI